jgi:hypothetical protein
LERAIGDIGSHICRNHEARIRAMSVLRNLLLREEDCQKASILQRELLDCLCARFGPNHPDTQAAQVELRAISFRTLDSASTVKV